MNRRHKNERAFAQKIGLIVFILAIIFMALVVVYELASQHQRLADDLTGAFSSNQK